MFPGPAGGPENPRISEKEFPFFYSVSGARNFGENPGFHFFIQIFSLVSRAGRRKVKKDTLGALEGFLKDFLKELLKHPLEGPLRCPFKDSLKDPLKYAFKDLLEHSLQGSLRNPLDSTHSISLFLS